MPDTATTGLAPGMRDHPLRARLNNEMHARPPEALRAPVRASHIAMLSGEGADAEDRAHLTRLCSHFGAPPPAPDAAHHLVDLGTARIKWERHTEFSSWTIFRGGGSAEQPFADPAASAVPQAWLAALPGQRLAALHVALVSGDGDPPAPEVLETVFGAAAFVGSQLAGGFVLAWTDFRIHADGYGRILLHDHGLGRQQAGRLVQRLVEIETYRMMALLAFPLARTVLPRIGAIEEALARATERSIDAKGMEDDRAILEQLTHLAAEVERSSAETAYRFGAARAYHALVQERIGELREQRIPGLQTFEEFMARRLAPALRTCEAVAARQENLSVRIARAGNLLRSRVDVVLEEQNAALLQSMDRRAQLQLRLQETVEGLSVVAISYYGVGLIGHAVEGLRAGGLVHVDQEVATGAAVPVVLALVWYGLHRLKKRLAGSH